MPIGRRSGQRAGTSLMRSILSLLLNREPNARPRSHYFSIDLLFELIFLHETDQVAARDLQLLRGAGLVAAVAADRRADHLALERFDGRGERACVVGGLGVLGRRELTDARRQE